MPMVKNLRNRDLRYGVLNGNREWIGAGWKEIKVLGT
jgi:hypothetical protein